MFGKNDCDLHSSTSQYQQHRSSFSSPCLQLKNALRSHWSTSQNTLLEFVVGGTKCVCEKRCCWAKWPWGHSRDHSEESTDRLSALSVKCCHRNSVLHCHMSFIYLHKTPLLASFCDVLHHLICSVCPMVAILCTVRGKLCNPVNAVTVEVRLLTWLLTELSAALSGHVSIKKPQQWWEKGTRDDH